MLTQWSSLALSAIAVLLIPLLVMTFRLVVKWTRAEDKLDHTVERLDELVRDKDAVHRELSQQMHEDRQATNKRLRWLEEHLWEQGRTR